MAGCAGEAASIGLAPGAGGQAGDFATDIWEGYAVTDLSTELARLAEAATNLREIVELGGYEVDPSGTIYSCRSNWRGYGRRALKAGVNDDGYASVRLMLNGRRKHLAIHRLVAEFYLPPKPSPIHEIRHKNGDRLDPRADNLQWGTRLENATDRTMHGNTAIGERNGFSRLTDAARHQISIDTRPKRAIARAFGVDAATVRRIKLSRHWGQANGC